MNTPVSGTPRTLLRAEGLAVLIASVAAYEAVHASWVLFAVLLLVPDVSMLGYLAGPRLGAVVYNLVHTYIGPAALAGLAYLGAAPQAWPVCLIWLAHIGMDRALGFGLKFPDAFQSTHLGPVGRRASTA